MYKKLINIFIIGLIIWATVDAFILRPNDFYSPIARGKLIGILLIIVLLPILYGIYLYTKTYVKTRDHNIARRESLSLLKSWFKIFTSTNKKRKK
jgi:hypothetical protein